MTVIRKSELARRLGVSRPRVSQYVALGMPVRDDGRIELERACEWVLGTIIDKWTDDASPAVRAAERILSGN
jgi:predicted transcriptional regulator